VLKWNYIVQTRKIVSDFSWGRCVYKMAISRKIHKTLLAETFEEKGTTKSKLKSNPENYYDCCESPMISKQGGYSVCKNCGVVHDRIIEKIPQRTFNAEDVCKKRICEPVYSPIGPRTVIRGNKDAKGSIMGSDFQRKFQDLRQYLCID